MENDVVSSAIVIIQEYSENSWGLKNKDCSECYEKIDIPWYKIGFEGKNCEFYGLGCKEK